MASGITLDSSVSERLGQECQPFDMTPPNQQLFSPENIVLINNGACVSTANGPFIKFAHRLQMRELLCSLYGMSVS